MKKILLLATAIMASLASFGANEGPTVEVFYNGSTATVTIPANLSAYVTVQSGESSHVKLIQSSLVDETVGEFTYVLSGSSLDGEFYMEGSYKATIEMSNLTLTNPSGPAINIQNGKRIKLSAKNETVNTLSDGVDSLYNGCVHCKGHLELKGKGVLNVTGNSKHAIYSKEYMQVKNITLNVLGAQKDALHCKEYFLMESGTVNIQGAGDDGIQVELANDANTGVTTLHEDENSGNFYMEDGVLTISGYQNKAIKADGTISYTGGTQNFNKTDTQEQAATNIMKLSVTTPDTQVYDLKGRKYSSTHALSKGVYLLRKDGQTSKVLVQ